MADDNKAQARAADEDPSGSSSSPALNRLRARGDYRREAKLADLQSELEALRQQVAGLRDESAVQEEQPLDAAKPAPREPIPLRPVAPARRTTTVPRNVGRAGVKQAQDEEIEGGLQVWLARIVMGLAGALVTVILLTTIGPRFLPYQTLTVLSGSMTPTLPVGSIIVDQPVQADQVRLRDIITFQRPDHPGELVTHRVVGFEQGSSGKVFVTKGDANSTPDSWRIAAAGSGWRYAFQVPYLGFILAWFQSPIGRLLLLIVPAIGLGAITLFEVWQPKPDMEEE